MNDFLDDFSAHTRKGGPSAERVLRKILAYAELGMNACSRLFNESGADEYLTAATAYGRAHSLALGHHLHHAATALIEAMEAQRDAFRNHQATLLHEFWPGDFQTKMFTAD